MKERKKTYSVAIRTSDGLWVTNWAMYNNFEDIDWQVVRESCIQKNCMAYGYYYGYKSYRMTSDKRRIVLETLT